MNNTVEVARQLDREFDLRSEERTVIQDLHAAPPEFPDLERAFADVQYKLSGQFATRFRMIIEGQPRQLKDFVRREAYWIGREALMNACRHSAGQSVEMEIGYRPDRVRLVVRDNGCGIDPEVLESGRHGHWGLVGMRERAERIKAQLRVFSRVKCGTEIELNVPGCVAFADNLAA